MSRWFLVMHLLRIAVIGTIVADGSVIRAEVVHGFADLFDYRGSGGDITAAIDFSTQELFRVDSTNSQHADLVAVIPENGDPCNCFTSLMSFNGATGRQVADTTLYDLTTAPELPYCCFSRPELDVTYVLRTADGLYVKFAVLSFGADDLCVAGGATIEFFVQTDGSPYFGSFVPVESSTWGRVKALYR